MRNKIAVMLMLSVVLLFTNLQTAYAYDNSWMHKFSDDDMQMLYQLVHAESGNQDLTTQEAVASVVINRVMSEYFPNSVSSVIFADGQFSVVDNGSIWCTPSEQSIQAVNNVCENGVTIKNNIYFFRNSHYHNGYTDEMQLGVLYFSSYGD